MLDGCMECPRLQQIAAHYKKKNFFDGPILLNLLSPMQDPRTVIHIACCFSIIERNLFISQKDLSSLHTKPNAPLSTSCLNIMSSNSNLESRIILGYEFNTNFDDKKALSRKD